MTTEIAKKLEFILSGTGTSKDEYNEIIDLMEEYKQCDIPSVGITLPKLITEDWKIEWLAYLDGIGGMVCSGKTEMEAIDELMISIKVKMLYDRGN